MRAAALLVLLAAACSEPVPAREFGEQMFRDPAFAGSELNAFSCSTCHRVDPDPSRILAGGALRNVVGRPSWWGGFEAQLFDAVDFCLVSFMHGAGLPRDEPTSKALYEYLVSISPEPAAPAAPFTVVKNVADVPRGDPARGALVYRAACQTCHGAPHSGEGRPTELPPVLPEVAAGYPVKFPAAAPSLVVIEKVRHGRFFGVGGNMPLFSLESLSDQDLGALLAFLAL